MVGTNQASARVVPDKPLVNVAVEDKDGQVLYPHTIPPASYLLYPTSQHDAIIVSSSSSSSHYSDAPETLSSDEEVSLSPKTFQNTQKIPQVYDNLW